MKLSFSPDPSPAWPHGYWYAYSETFDSEGIGVSPLDAVTACLLSAEKKGVSRMNEMIQYRVYMKSEHEPDKPTTGTYAAESSAQEAADWRNKFSAQDGTVFIVKKRTVITSDWEEI